MLHEQMAAFLSVNSIARRLSERMREETGTDFFEWIDHLVLPPEAGGPLRGAGFVADENVETPAGEMALHHPRATLPRVILRPGPERRPSAIALRPESVADFMARHNLEGEIEGAPLSRYRSVLVLDENGTRLEAVERHAYRLVSRPRHCAPASWKRCSGSGNCGGRESAFLPTTARASSWRGGC